MNCPQCQRPLRDDARFCTHCGYKTASIPVSANTGNANTPTEVLEAKLTNESKKLTGAFNDPLVGHTLDGKYELVGRLGEGGMGAVYRARRVHIGDDVAVKVLHPKFVDDDSSMERFRREARAAAQLHHRNVVIIHDYGEAVNETDTPAYIVMELVDGVSLRDILRGQGRLPVARAVKLMRDICAGVSAAHRRGIVHRDLKPDNVIVTDDPDNEGEKTVKVVDFGIAKLRDKTNEATLTQVGMVVGTPFYMSPEQCRGEHLDVRADVYSLSAMFYEMLAGQPPFVAPNVTGVVAKHLTEAPPPLPSEINAPPALQNVIMRALSKDPNGRPEDAAAFARELQSAMDETIVAPRPTTSGEFAANAVSPNTPQTSIAAHASSQQISSGNYQSAQPNAAQYNTPETMTRTPPPADYQNSAQYRNARDEKKSSRGVWMFLGLAAIVVFGLVAVAGVLMFVVPSRNNRANRIENRNERVSPSPLPSAKASVTPTPEEILPLQRAENKILNDAALTTDDLNNVPPNQLRFLRNAIYARHGRVFNDPDLQRYFNSRAWYKPSAKYSDASLTANDRANVSFIKAFEDGGKSQSSAIPTPPASPAAVAAARAEVNDVVNAWAEATDERNVDALMNHYADTLETYYRKSNVPAAQVRAERARVYGTYNEINVRLTNISIEVDPSATEATVMFDKTWDFDGARRSTGSVRQEMRLRKINGSWRIVGEKDLKVYYSSSGINVPDGIVP